MPYTGMCVKTIVKHSVSDSKVILECEAGNRVTCPKHLLKALRLRLKSIHFVK